MIFENDKPLKECYGILYDENNNEAYKRILYEERPKEAKNITIYDNDLNEIYIGDFYNFEYNGKGTLYYKEYNRIYFKGIFKNDLYENGILYDPEGNIIYEGDFMKDIIKNIKIYDLEGYLKYEGDYYKSKYYGFGKLYERYYCIYEGFFKDGLYEGEGKLRQNRVGYEGTFKEGKYHGFGKLYNYIGGNRYLYYEGNFNLGNFEGKGELYYRENKEVSYQKKNLSGIFKNNEINGKGIKYYKNGKIKFDGIFNTINSFQGIYYSPFGDTLYQGNIINEKPDDDKYMIIYNDDGNIQYEGEIMNGKYEGKGIEYSNCIKDKILYYGDFSNDYYIDTNIVIKKNELSSNLLIISDDDHSPGKTKLFERIILNKYDDREYSSTINISFFPLKYIYNHNNYSLNIFDTARDSYQHVNLVHITFYKPIIVIYVFNLKSEEYEKRISKYFINEIIEKQQNPYIYLVGTKLDDFNGDLSFYRKKAQDLIDKGKIKKYFEISSKTGEGIDFLVKNIKIDNAMFLNGTNIDFSLDKVKSFRDYIENIDLEKKFRKNKFVKSNKFNNIKKYQNF